VKALLVANHLERCELVRLPVKALEDLPKRPLA
jgi:hypothetical protein